MRLTKLEKYHAMLLAQRHSEMCGARLAPGSGYEYQSPGEILQDEQDGGLAGATAALMRKELGDALADEAKLKVEYEVWLAGMDYQSKRLLDRRLDFPYVYHDYEPDPVPVSRPEGVDEHGWLTLKEPVETVAVRDFLLEMPGDPDGGVLVKAGDKVVITGVPGGDPGHGYMTGDSGGYVGGLVGPSDVADYDRIWDMHPWNYRCPQGHMAIFENVSYSDDMVFVCECPGKKWTQEGRGSKKLIPFCMTCDVLVQQIQLKAKKGNRWLYKLPAGLFDHVLGRFAATFPGRDLWLTEGASLARRIWCNYDKATRDTQFPASEQERVSRWYDQPLMGYERAGETKNFHGLALVRLARKEALAA